MPKEGPPNNEASRLKAEMRARAKEIETYVVNNVLQGYLLKNGYPDITSVPAGIVDNARTRWQGLGPSELILLANMSNEADWQVEPLAYLELARMLKAAAK